MDEIVPVILGALFAAFLWYRDAGRTRLLLSVFAVVLSAATATLLSGEYLKSWTYLLLDLSETSLGFTVGFAIARYSLRPEESAVMQRTQSLPLAASGPAPRPEIKIP